MHLLMVHSAERCIYASWRKWRRKVLCEATKLTSLYTMSSLETQQNPPYTSLPCPIHMAVSFSMGKRLTKVNWSLQWCANSSFFL